MRPLLVWCLAIVLIACGGRDEPEIPLESLLPPEPEAQESAPTEPVCSPLAELTVSDWQALLDRDFTNPKEPGPHRLRSVLKAGLPGQLTGPALRSARLRVLDLAWTLTDTGGIRLTRVLATAYLRHQTGVSLAKPARDLFEMAKPLLPQDTKLEIDEGKDLLRLRLVGGQPKAAPADCDRNPPAPSGNPSIRLRLAMDPLLAVLESGLGSPVMWSVLPEEIATWRGLELDVFPAGEDRISLRLLTGEGELPGLLLKARFPAREGWHEAIPKGSPLIAGAFLNQADHWTARLSELLFAKGFKLEALDPEEILNDTWATQLGTLASGPILLAQAGPIPIKAPTRNLAWYIQATETGNLDERLRRVFNSRRYHIRDETFTPHIFTVVRHKRKKRLGRDRFTWTCLEAGCWMSRRLNAIHSLVKATPPGDDPTAARVRAHVEGDALAFVVLHPRSIAGHLEWPKASTTEKIVLSMARGKFRRLPDDLYIDAHLEAGDGSIRLEITGLGAGASYLLTELSLL